MYALVAYLQKLNSMVIISKTILNEFAGSHPDAAKTLRKWYEEVKSAE